MHGGKQEVLPNGARNGWPGLLARPGSMPEWTPAAVSLPIVRGCAPIEPDAWGKNTAALDSILPTVRLDREQDTDAAMQLVKEMPRLAGTML